MTGQIEQYLEQEIASLRQQLAECQTELEAMKKDAERYRWLVANSFDRQRTQLHVWVHTWEPHSQTGEPIEWKHRVRGTAIDEAIDTAMRGEGE